MIIYRYFLMTQKVLEHKVLHFFLTTFAPEIANSIETLESKFRFGLKYQLENQENVLECVFCETAPNNQQI